MGMGLGVVFDSGCDDHPPHSPPRSIVWRMCGKVGDV